MNETQSIIQRFAWQSFGIKGFSLTYLGLIIGIFNDPEYQNEFLFLLLLISVSVFHCLDAYYLSMERIYIKVEKYYDEEKGLSYRDYGFECCIGRAFISLTVLPIYAIQYALIIILYLK